jgi:hypothetical protein
VILSLLSGALLQINNALANGHLQEWPKTLAITSRAPAHSGQGRGLGSCWHRRLLSTILSATAQNAPAPIFCLPRLNKTCPNPSKWRESLGFAGVARPPAPAVFHNAPLRGLTSSSPTSVPSTS